MWVTLLLSLAAACEMPNLPDSLAAVQPSYRITKEVDVFGKYLLSEDQISWTIDVQTDSWLRTIAEPYHTLLAITLHIVMIVTKAMIW